MDNLKAVTDELYAAQGHQPGLANKEIYAIGRKYQLDFPTIHKLFINDFTRVERGVYNVKAAKAELPDEVEEPIEADEVEAEAPTGDEDKRRKTRQPKSQYVPDYDKTYTPWGASKVIRTIIDSNRFFPVYIAGMSGNGKTMMVEQSCARSKRDYIRVQINPMTDEDDLLGGFRLVNGDTVFSKGPVILAMELGAILLIDELDRGSNKIMCLQGVLEGKPVLIKKTGEIIHPKPGFNVIATANTKGRGNDDGRYSAAQLIDDAFLERFVAAIDQPYPGPSIERNILQKNMQQNGLVDNEFIEHLVTWSDSIRQTFETEGVDEVISTRRLVHIVNTFSVFKNRQQSIELCISRFDAETRDAFLDLYSKFDPTVKKQAATAKRF